MNQLVTWGAIFSIVFLATNDPRAAFIALALCMLVERCFGLRRETAAVGMPMVPAKVESQHRRTTGIR